MNDLKSYLFMCGVKKWSYEKNMTILDGFYRNHLSNNFISAQEELYNILKNEEWEDINLTWCP